MRQSESPCPTAGGGERPPDVPEPAGESQSLHCQRQIPNRLRAKEQRLPSSERLSFFVSCLLVFITVRKNKYSTKRLAVASSQLWLAQPPCQARGSLSGLSVVTADQTHACCSFMGCYWLRNDNVAENNV
ncbi:hypothetical protein V2G26_020070 [Clonostachys chloroleuca]